MAESAKAKKDLESLSELFINYAQASREAYFEAQKQYYSACRNYLETVQGNLKQKPVQEAGRAYAESVHKGWTSGDPQEYNEAVRQYADASQAAATFLQTQLLDSTKALNEEIHKTITAGAEAQKAEVEKLLEAFHDAICNTKAKSLDSATLANLAHATLAAAWLRAQFE